MVIKLILFDLGGVIENHNLIGLSSYIEKKYKINAKKFHEILINDLRLNDKCAITDNEMINKINKEFKLKYTLKSFYNDYFKFISLYLEVLKFIKEKLKGKYKIALFTNCRNIHINHSVKLYHYDKIFDKIFVSQTYCTRKPEIKFYKIALKEFNVKPNETIFVDDKIRNIIPANLLGINGIVYDGKLDYLKKELKNYVKF